jgi:hypothetical protein
MPQEMDAANVQDWTQGLKLCPTKGATAATRSAKAHAMLPAEKGSTVNYKLNCPASHEPYAEALLETDPGKLLAILAATEVAVFQRLWELSADQDASGLSCASCAQVFSSVEKHADGRTSNLVRPRSAKNCELLIPSHTRCILAS